MRVALTGASGVVGRAIVHELLAQAHTVYASTRQPDLLQGFEQRLSIVNGDLRAEGTRRALLNDVEAIIHCAGALRTPDRDLLYDINVHVTAEIARLAAAEGLRRFVYISSTGVYGRPGRTLNETSPVRPQNDYERSKRGGEIAIERILPADRRVILRPSNVIAEHQGHRPLLRFLRHLIDQRLVYAPGAQVNYVHVSTVARAAVVALNDEAPPVAIVNDGLGLAEFAALCRRALGAEPRRDFTIPPFAAFLIAAALDRGRSRSGLKARLLSLVDDTLFESQYRDWLGQLPPIAAVATWVPSLVECYRQEKLL